MPVSFLQFISIFLRTEHYTRGFFRAVLAEFPTVPRPENCQQKLHGFSPFLPRRLGYSFCLSVRPPMCERTQLLPFCCARCLLIPPGSIQHLEDDLTAHMAQAPVEQLDRPSSVKPLVQRQLEVRFLSHIPVRYKLDSLCPRQTNLVYPPSCVNFRFPATSLTPCSLPTVAFRPGSPEAPNVMPCPPSIFFFSDLP